MNIDKAIEILMAIIQTGEYEGDPDDSDAIKLGLEALKRQQRLRLSRITWFRGPLPGETLG